MSVEWSPYNGNDPNRVAPVSLSYRYAQCWGFSRSGFYNISDGIVYKRGFLEKHRPFQEYILGLPRLAHVCWKELDRIAFFIVPHIEQTRAAWLNNMQLLRTTQSYNYIADSFTALRNMGFSDDRAFCLSFLCDIFEESGSQRICFEGCCSDDAPVAGIYVSWKDIKDWETGLKDFKADEVMTSANSDIANRPWDFHEGYRFSSGLIAARTCLPCGVLDAARMSLSYKRCAIFGDDYYQIPEEKKKAVQEASVAHWIIKEGEDLEIPEFVKEVNERIDAA